MTVQPLRVLVRGGLVQGVYGPEHYAVEVLYHEDDGPDDSPEEGDEMTDVDGERYTITRLAPREESGS